MIDPHGLQARLQQLRDAFDDSFAHQVATDTIETLDMLEISVGKQPFLLSMSDVRSIHVARPITVVPTRSESLLGLSGLRGAMFAVHDLGTLLGVATDRTAPWFVVARRAPIAFGFQSLTRHLRLERDALMAPVDPQQLLGAEATLEHGTRCAVIQIERMVEQLLADNDRTRKGEAQWGMK